MSVNTHIELSGSHLELSGSHLELDCLGLYDGMELYDGRTESNGRKHKLELTPDLGRSIWLWHYLMCIDSRI